jgi:hypothetical protein
MLGVMRQLLALLVLVPLVGGVMAACEGEETAQGLCNPGENIFCRCRGGDAGTKQCAEDGASFDQCTSTSGPCPEIGGSSSSSSSSTGTGGSTSGLPLLEPCEQNTECQSELCRMGHCTKDCAKWQECTDEAAEIFGDCMAVGGTVQQCVPYCYSQDDCDLFGSPSECGYAPAVDALYVAVCADWGVDGPPLPPIGYDCYTDIDCNLAHLGKELVCEFAFCISGCHDTTDCPDGTTCSGGSPGQCQ